MNILFAHPEYKYDSYSDYRALAALSGFENVFVKDIDLERDALYIVSPVNGELRPHLSHKRSLLKGPQKAKVVWWNLERPDSGPGDLGKLIGSQVCNTTNEILQWVNAIWVSDRYYASLDSRMIFVPMGSDPRITGSPLPVNPRGLPKSYDWCHLSYQNDRRRVIYTELLRRGCREAPNGWATERDQTLKASRTMVYVHQTPAPIGAPLRWALAAAYKIPLLCENLADPYPLEPGKDLMMCDYKDLAQNVPGWICSEAIAYMGEHLHQKLCVDHNFRKSVEQGVRAIIG
jgi:hypothetical protein